MQLCNMLLNADQGARLFICRPRRLAESPPAEEAGLWVCVLWEMLPYELTIPRHQIIPSCSDFRPQKEDTVTTYMEGFHFSNSKGLELTEVPIRVGRVGMTWYVHTME